MPDLTDDLLPKLHAHRLPGIDLGEGLIHPKYDGGSILNIPPTICRMFGIFPLGSGGALSPEICQPLMALSEGVQRVILVLVDALALHRLRRWLADGRAPFWAGLVEQGLLAPLTSIVPSTTSAAIPTLWSGLSPAEHGLVGYELWLREYGVVANMISHSPFKIPGKLEDAGFKPEEALPGPTLGIQLGAYGVRSYAFQHAAIANSGMSRMFMKHTEVQSFRTAAELMINLRTLIETASHERKFIGVYWGEVDHYSHIYGPDDERPAAEFAHFTAALRDYLIDPLKPAARQGTLLLLTADHGQVLTPRDALYELNSHPNLARRLPMLPTGENRMVYFNIRPGQVEAVREYVARAFFGQFAQIDPGHAVASGLFGPGEPHPRLRDRIGDLIAIPRGNAHLWWGEKESPIVGRHGGMTAEEMLVPLLAARLG
jgi:hypothetical protein